MEEITICLKGIGSSDCPPQLIVALKQLEVEFIQFRLGFLTIRKLYSYPLAIVEAHLESHGFVPIKDKQGQLVEQVKHLVFSMFNDDQFQKSRLNVSHYIAAQAGRSYEHISRAFSKVEGMTLEKFIIAQRIEQAKLFLLDRDLTLMEVAHKLGYSSVQHLSRQFHQICGMTVRAYLQHTQDPSL